MEPLTNTCEYSEAHLTEAMSYQMKKLQRKRYLILGGAVALLTGFSLFVYLRQKDQRYLLYAIIGALMLVLLTWSVRDLARKAARRQAAQIRERNRSSDFRTVFLEEGFTIANVDEAAGEPIPYDEVSELVRTPHLILLFTDANQMLMLDPVRFQPGGEAAFQRLAQERFPRACPLERSGRGARHG